MSPSPALRPRLRALSVISISAALVTFVSVWASRQQAVSPSHSAGSHAATVPFVIPDKGAITPEASTITVNSLSDVADGTDGLCTLREAITAANDNAASGAVAGECAAGNSSGSDAIDLTAVAGTINLTGVLPDITTNITMNGPGSSQLTVRRNTGGDYRIFTVDAGGVSMSGLTATNGRAPDASAGSGNPGTGGGGILNAATLSLTDVALTGNRSGNGGSAPGTGGHGGYGGGLYNLGSLTMTNCAVTGNVAGDGGSNAGSGGFGGGIAHSGTALTINSSVFTGNSAGRGGNGTSGGDGGDGGGIYCDSGFVTLTRINVGDNNAGDSGSPSSGFAGSGGGIGIIRTNLTITDSTVSGNHSGSGGLSFNGLGGGIYNNGATLLVTGTTISGNTSAGTGGGIMNRGGMRLGNTTISGNTASDGGAIFDTSNAQVALTNVTVTGNSAVSGIHGINVSGSSNSNNIMQNTIIALNGSGPDISGQFTSFGHNLIGNSSGNGFSNAVNGDQVGTSGSPLNPQLGALANNGGPTQTHALLPNSPALDAGDNCVIDAAHCGSFFVLQLLTDQRGTVFNRLVDGPDANSTATVDIGAHETQAALADLVATSTNEDTQVVIPFDGGDTSTITSVTASSSNATLVPNDAAHLSVVMTGSTGVVTINPATNENGATNITVTINRTGGPESNTFLLTVNAVNDPPSFTKGADPVINEDAGAQTVNWATAISPGAANESSQILTFQVTGNTNTVLFATGPAISPAGTLTYTPAANVSGSATITINLKDNGGTDNGGVDTSAAQSFTITVNSVNDVPSFTKGPDQTVNEDSDPPALFNWATGLSAGPTNEQGQILSFQITNNTNPSLFLNGPAVSSTGTLTFTPTANAHGSATITLVIKDNGGIANGGVDTSAPQSFTITVNPVNDRPTFTKGPNQTVNEDAGAQTVNNWATAISPGSADEAGQVVNFNITNNTNAALFSAGPAVSSTGTLTYTPVANANGSATITINLHDDGGTVNGGVDTSVAQTFTITVNSVNDVPSFTKGGDQSVNNSAGPQTVANWATNLSPGPANESGQTLTFEITNNSNPGIFSAGPAVNSAGTLTYTPNANAGGTATITINVRDNGGTANGGVDASPSQIFTITTVAVGGTFNFSAATYNTTESSGFTTVTVKRTGDLGRAVTVDYASSGDNGLPCSTANGAATPKCDFTTALGTLSFGVGDDTKMVNILISQDGFVEGPETFTVTLSNPTLNSALGATSTSTMTIADDATEPAPPVNVIDEVRNFVRQHYHDFLNREPDPSGWDFWSNQISSCGSDVPCNEVRRVDVSASFFLSIEFQQTGYLVERFYKVAYGDATGNSTFVSNHTLNVPIVRFNEFLKDTQRIGQGFIVLQPGWEQALENNKLAYALEFVQTTRFTTALPTTLTPAAFVDRLNQNSGGVLSLSERTTAINFFGGAANSSNVTARAQAVRMVAEDVDLYNAESNRAFVLAEYFGYLRRNPNDAPDSDYTGYDFWLTKLNQFNGNYINAEMVKAFLSSIEYRQRFGP